jgi:para-nitrobenzyl esterase
MDRPAAEIESAIVDAPCGRLAGVRISDIFVFKGIPFAKPPVGELRWRWPEPLPPWAGVRDATHFGPICPQAPTQIEALLGGSLGEQSEDCLYLNVWTAGCDDARRPVMVWIHGGAFVIGAGSQGLYNGRHLAEQDCVIVTINYRLGVFGFLNLSDATGTPGSGSGAEGIADQVMALRWVQQNIAAFGGDPDNVTIFGESAGAMSASILLSMPAGRGLFHKAIAQSGAAHVGYDRERSKRVAQTFVGLLKAEPDAARLREIPFSALVKAQIALLADLRQGRDARRLGSVAFQPTIGNDLIPQRPIEALRAGAAAGIPILTGTTKDEWRLFSSASPRARFTSRSAFEERVRKAAGDAAPALLAAYADGTTFDRFNAFMTDRVFTMPAIRMLEAQGTCAPVYAYRFDWSSRLLGGIMGSCHAIDLGFVFGTYKTKLAGAFFGTGPTADALARTMMQAWTTFARTGNPSSASTGPWTQYDTESRTTMIFGDGGPRAEQDPNRVRRIAWEAVADSRLGP